MAAAGTFGAFGGLMSDTHGLHEAMKQEGWCFVAGTLIKTKEGNKAIEEIEVGDLVYARNTETGEEGYKEVVRLFPNSTEELVHVAIGDTVIDTTPAHRFWVEGKDFLPARDLQVGDRVLTASGELKEITSIERESLEEPVPVYNFEVKDWHTHYVSGEEILVHNVYGTPEGANVNQANGKGGSGVLDNANYAQKTYSNTFSAEGRKIYSDLAGEPINTIDDLVNAINSGKVNVADFPVEYIVRDGNTLINLT